MATFIRCIGGGLVNIDAVDTIDIRKQLTESEEFEYFVTAAKYGDGEELCSRIFRDLHAGTLEECREFLKQLEDNLANQGLMFRPSIRVLSTRKPEAKTETVVLPSDDFSDIPF